MILLRALLVVFVITLSAQLTTAQQTVIIDSIQFEGIKKNKPSYLKLFVKHNPGATLNESQLKREVQTLQNLPSLFNVSSRVDHVNGKNILVFECEESLTLLPFFNFGRGENQESFWFQAGASEFNLFGRGIQVYGYYQYKEKHTAVLSIRNPFLFGSKWGLSLGLKKWTTNEPLYFGSNAVRFQYDNYYLEAAGIRTFSYGHHIEFGGSIFKEIYTKLQGENASLGPQYAEVYKYLGKINYQYDRINYFYHYRSGYALNINTSTVTTEGKPGDFYQGDIILRYYKRLKKRGNLSLRAGVGLSTNNKSPFAAYVLDSQTNLRGIGDRVARGTGIFYFNAEYNHTIFDKNWYAITGTAFTDYGTLRYPGTNISTLTEENSQNVHAGIGARFILKKIYNAVFRVDYGHSLKKGNTNEFVIGLGHYF